MNNIVWLLTILLGLLHCPAVLNFDHQMALLTHQWSFNWLKRRKAAFIKKIHHHHCSPIHYNNNSYYKLSTYYVSGPAVSTLLALFHVLLPTALWFETWLRFTDKKLRFKMRSLCLQSPFLQQKPRTRCSKAAFAGKTCFVLASTVLSNTLNLNTFWQGGLSPLDHSPHRFCLGGRQKKLEEGDHLALFGLEWKNDPPKSIALCDFKT